MRLIVNLIDESCDGVLIYKKILEGFDDKMVCVRMLFWRDVLSGKYFFVV